MKRALAVGAVLALALAIACQIPDHHFQVRIDAPGSADAPIDTMIDADLGPCNLAGPWGLPVQLTQLSNALSVSRFTVDELTAYYATGSNNTPTGSDYLYVTQRSGIGSAFGPVMPLTSLNGSGAATTPSISADGQTLYYTYGASGARDIYRAPLIIAPDQFGSGTVTSFSSALPDDFAYVGSDGAVWFSTGSANMLQISVAKPAGGSAFTAPVQESELNSPGQTNLYPLVTWDQLGIYFERAGVIYYASRTTTAPQSFGIPQKISELASGSGVCAVSGQYCRPAFISKDGCRLYIGANAVGTPIDMYVSSKPANP